MTKKSRKSKRDKPRLTVTKRDVQHSPGASVDSPAPGALAQTHAIAAPQHKDYRYVRSDLLRSFGTAGIVLAVLIILYIFLG